jgi:hypothetical protein
MDELDDWLRGVCQTPEGEPYLRPFGPNAKWRDAQVFLVGTNPSTPIRHEFGSFDDYWRALTENTDEFDRVYRSLNTGGMTETTKNTRRIVEAAGQINFLMTNAYPYPARKPKQIPRRQAMERLGNDIVTRLLHRIRPSAVVFHGNPAIQLGWRVTARLLDRTVPVSDQRWSFTIPETDQQCSAYAIPHLCGAGAPKGYCFDGVFGTLPLLLRDRVNGA